MSDRYEARVPHDFVIKDDQRHEGDEFFAAVLEQAPGLPDNSTFVRVDVEDAGLGAQDPADAKAWAVTVRRIY